MLNEYISDKYLSHVTTFRVVKCSNLCQYIKGSQPLKQGNFQLLVVVVKKNTLIITLKQLNKVVIFNGKYLKYWSASGQSANIWLAAADLKYDASKLAKKRVLCKGKKNLGIEIFKYQLILFSIQLLNKFPT